MQELNQHELENVAGGAAIAAAAIGVLGAIFVAAVKTQNHNRISLTEF
mgnify:CR=1 FL=1